MSEDILQRMLEASGQDSPFAPESRYHGVGLAEYTLPDGRILPYAKRRFIPPPEQFSAIARHTVAAGDRIDNLAARYLGDPGQYWRIADANVVVRPEEATDTPGRNLDIALPAGVTTPGETSG